MPTVIITGANRGIGLAFAQLYSQQNYRVIGVCRHSSSALERCAHEVIDQIDVTNTHHVDQLSHKLNREEIDI